MIGLSEAGLSVAAGGLTTLSPCVFPLLPLVLGGALHSNRAAPLAMGVGMTLSFAAIGVAIGLLGDFLNLSPDGVRTGSAMMLLLFGLIMVVPWLNERFINLISPLASNAHRASSSLDGSSLRGAFLMGCLLGLIWSPCSGPLLGSALTLVASEGGVARGALILGLFGLGAALPLVGAAYLSQSGFGRVREWVLTHGDQSKKVFGMLLLLVGVTILSGSDRWLEARVNQHLPDVWLQLTTGI
jgi:cytochrome c-type biogenesis protein